MIHEVARHEKTLIPEDFSYTELTGLTLEAREKLARIRPKNLGQAGRIPGVSPSDVAQLSIALAAKRAKVLFAHQKRTRKCPLLSRRGRHESRAARP